MHILFVNVYKRYKQVFFSLFNKEYNFLGIKLLYYTTGEYRYELMKT